MLNEEQKKQIRQMAAGGAGYRETLKCVLASKQDIIDYRNELVETGWTPREEETDAEWKQNSCLWCGKEYMMQQQEENVNSAAINADVNIICFIR